MGMLIHSLHFIHAFSSLTSEWIYNYKRHVQRFKICCSWSRLKPVSNVSANKSTMPQINVIPHQVTLNWHQTNQ